MGQNIVNRGNGRGTEMGEHDLEKLVVRVFGCKDHITLRDKDFLQGYVGK